MSVDFSGTQELLDSMKDIQKNHEKFIRNFLLEMGMRALRKTKKLTPIDTGYLRNRWELSEVYRKGDELFIVLSNPTEYASWIEEGHHQKNRLLPIKRLEDGRIKYEKGSEEHIFLKTKWIEGKHMARISINEIDKQIPKRYEKALKLFMATLGEV